MSINQRINDEAWAEKVAADLREVIHAPFIFIQPAALSLQAKMRPAVERFLSLHRDRLPWLLPPPEPKLPLGKWYERVLRQAFIISFPDGHVRHSVADGKGGELDFVLESFEGVTHVECAIKFFLRMNHSGALSSWVGPGGRDRLDLKYSKMNDVQLRRNPPETFIDAAPVKKVAWMTGRLHEYFYEDNLQVGVWRQEQVNVKAIRGFWAYADQWNEIMNLTGGRWVKLPRLWWMTSLSGFRAETISVLDPLAATLTDDVPTMAVQWADNQGDCAEIQRIILIQRNYNE